MRVYASELNSEEQVKSDFRDYREIKNQRGSIDRPSCDRVDEVLSVQPFSATESVAGSNPSVVCVVGRVFSVFLRNVCKFLLLLDQGDPIRGC